MGYIIKKTTIHTYDIIQVVINFVDVETLIRVRKNMKRKMNTCFICNKKLEDLPYKHASLAAIYNKGNEVLCKSCALDVAKQPEVKVIDEENVNDKG